MKKSLFISLLAIAVYFISCADETVLEPLNFQALR